jgi:hypothetical protein
MVIPLADHSTGGIIGKDRAIFVLDFFDAALSQLAALGSRHSTNDIGRKISEDSAGG